MSQKAILAFIGVVGAVTATAFLLNRAKGEEIPCTPLQAQISIDQVIPIRQEESDRFWIFDAKYRNRTCVPVTFDIIMQIEFFDKDFGRFFVRDLQNRVMTLNPGESRDFKWRVIFTEETKHRMTFLVWQTLNSGTAVGNKKIVEIPQLDF